MNFGTDSKLKTATMTYDLNSEVNHTVSISVGYVDPHENPSFRSNSLSI